jgi:hypothetical protein
MERASKLIALVFASAALAGVVWLAARAWPALQPMAAALFLAGAVLALVDRRSVAGVLVFAYLFPAIISVAHGQYHVYFSALWLSPLLGALVPAACRTSWHVPKPWRGPLVLAALAIAVSTPIVVLREIDFHPALLFQFHEGGAPPVTVAWILHAALVLVIGILWFDWLFDPAAPDFHASVALPLAASFLAMALVANYQLFVDVTALNQTVYGVLARASGTMLDANVCGTLAALWIGGVALCAREWGRWRVPATVGGGTLAWLAVWASGSRTAFGAATIVTVFTLLSLVRVRERLSLRLGVALALGGATAVAGMLLLLARADLGVVGPLDRLRVQLWGPGGGSAGRVVAELWNRNQYGSVSTRMIGEFPLVGVGVGSFHNLVSDFAGHPASEPPLPPDNAQNWLRHQVAELGVLGGFGWLAWAAVFGWFVVRARRGEPAPAWIARGMLVAFAVVSFVGMPGQDVSVAITFWTVAFWYARATGTRFDARALTPFAWAAIAAVIAAFGVGTAYVAATELRPPFRAARFGYPYSYGFYAPEPGPDGGVQRWARRRALIVLAAESTAMDVSVAVNHLDLDAHPVHAKVWLDGALVTDTRLTSAEPVTTQVSLPRGGRRVVLETWASRAVNPRELGVPDDRELGLLVRWSFPRDQGARRVLESGSGPSRRSPRESR